MNTSKVGSSGKKNKSIASSPDKVTTVISTANNKQKKIRDGKLQISTKRKSKLNKTSPEVELGLKLEALLDKNIKSGSLSPPNMNSECDSGTPKHLKRKFSNLGSNIDIKSKVERKNVLSEKNKFDDKYSSLFKCGKLVITPLPGVKVTPVPCVKKSPKSRKVEVPSPKLKNMKVGVNFGSKRNLVNNTEKRKKTQLSLKVKRGKYPSDINDELSDNVNEKESDGETTGTVNDNVISKTDIRNVAQKRNFSNFQSGKNCKKKLKAGQELLIEQESENKSLEVVESIKYDTTKMKANQRNMVGKKVKAFKKLKFNKVRGITESPVSECDDNEVLVSKSEDSIISEKKESEEKNSYLNEEKILGAVKALMKLHARTTSNKMNSQAQNPQNQNLFSNTHSDIKVQINTIKNPETPKNFIRILLKYPLVPEDGDICLFVSNMKKNKSQPEVATDHYSKRLKNYNVHYIKEIIPLKQLQTDYSQYEQKRKLSFRFDLFLVEASVCHRIIGLLGKSFYKNHRIPVPVRMTEGLDIKENIDKAIKKTTIISIGNSRNSFTAKVGHTELSEEEITSNIMALASALETNFPGGWRNIRSLYICAGKTRSIPIYYSLLSPNKVAKPKVENKLKMQPPVSGELSTILGGKVVVYPSGEVRVRRRKIKDDSDDEKNSEKNKIDTKDGLESEKNDLEVESVKEEDEVGDNDESEGVSDEDEGLTDEEDEDVSNEEDEAVNNEEDEDVSNEEDEAVNNGEDEDVSDDEDEGMSDEDEGMSGGEDEEMNDEEDEGMSDEDEGLSDEDEGMSDVIGDDETSESVRENEKDIKVKSAKKFKSSKYGTELNTEHKEQSESDDELINNEEENFMKNWEKEYFKGQGKKNEHKKGEKKKKVDNSKPGVVNKSNKIEKPQRKGQIQKSKPGKNSS